MRGRGILIPVAVSALVLAAAVAFIFLAHRESVALPVQEIARASEINATPLRGDVTAQDGADRLLQRERTGHPCAVATPTMGCPPFTPIRQVPVFVVRDSLDRIRAFIGEDPRNSCRLLWRPDIHDGVFYDPCHGSLYDRQGRVVGGPSPWNLNEWAVDLRAGSVFVDPAKIITGQAPGFAGR